MSDTGSVDKAVLEAMSCAVPVLVNPVFREVLGPELAEQCIVDWNAEQLCERLRRLIDMPCDERRKLGDTLRGLAVREHNLDALCIKLIEELRGIIR
jgi:glycosyltransferase involved in cell wall biosynthesis